jgi:hypothetical protein
VEGKQIGVVENVKVVVLADEKVEGENHEGKAHKHIENLY